MGVTAAAAVSTATSVATAAGIPATTNISAASVIVPSTVVSATAEYDAAADIGCHVVRVNVGWLYVFGGDVSWAAYDDSEAKAESRAVSVASNDSATVKVVSALASSRCKSCGSDHACAKRSQGEISNSGCFHIHCSYLISRLSYF